MLWLVLAVGAAALIIILSPNTPGKSPVLRAAAAWIRSCRERFPLFRHTASADFTQANGLIRYSTYRLSRGEYAVCLSVSALALFMIGYLFYRNIALALLLSMGAAAAPRQRSRQLANRRQEELKRQFKHALYALSTSLGAGKSVENAFRDVVADLQILYPDGRAYILHEFEIINRRVENGEPVEWAVRDFSLRAEVEEIGQFAEVFATCKRTGGDLIEVVRRTANLIGEKMDIEQEIAVLVAQKRFEAKALSFIPFGIVAFLTWSSPDYMEPLYHGTGYALMTLALALLALSCRMALSIMNIKA